MQKRCEYLDALRTLACFLVVLTHSSMPSVTGTDGVWKSLISFICSPATQIFFAISGALIIKSDVQVWSFLKKRLFRLLPPVIFWSIITMLVYCLLGKNSWEEAFWRIVLLPFQPVIGIYWFIYVIIGLYFLTPILSSFIVKSSKSMIEFYLLLWGVTLLLPYLNLINIPYWNTYIIIGSYYQTLIYFGGFAGFFLLGYYLRIYPIVLGNNRRFWVMFLGTVISAGVTFYMKYYHVQVNLDDYLIIGQFFYTALIFTLFQNIPDSFLHKRIWKTFSIYSFGIYLIHPIIVRDLVWGFFENHRMHALLETPLIAFVSLLICWIILAILSRFSGLKWMTGI